MSPRACRSAWAVRLTLCVLLAAATGCAGTRIVRYPGGPDTGRAVVERARAYAGASYRPGGAGPDGFDCSGFVQYLYGGIGIALPRTAATQFEVGRAVDASRLAPGDLVFFRTEGRRVSHVGVAVGDGTFIHAPNARSRVRVDRLDLPYWQQRYAGARRIAP